MKNLLLILFLFLFYNSYSQDAISTSKYTATVIVDSSYGNDATGMVGYGYHAFKTIDAALDAAAGLFSRIIEIHSGAYSQITSSKIKSGTWFKGSGQPNVNNTVSISTATAYSYTTPTALVGGTIIKGGFHVLGLSNIKITDLGVDQGSDFIASGGALGDCIGFSTLNGNSTTPPYTAFTGIFVERCTTLQNSATSTYHGIVAEGGYEFGAKDNKCYLGFAGFVSKNVGGYCIGQRSFGCGSFGIIIKANTYGISHDFVLSNFEIDGGGGLTLQDDYSGLFNVTIGNGEIRNCTYGIAQANGFLSNIQIANVQINNCSGKGYYFTDIRNSSITGGNVNGCTGLAIDAAGKGLAISNLYATGNGGGIQVSGTSTAQPTILRGNTSISNTGNGYLVAGANVYGANNYGDGITGTMNTFNETTGPAAATPTTITFPTVNNIAETSSGSGIWQSSNTVTGYGHTGKSALSLPAGTTGRIYATFQQQFLGQGQSSFLIFSTNNTLAGYNNTTASSWGINPGSNGQIGQSTNGVYATISGQTFTSTIYIGLQRDGTTGVIKAQKSTDLITWTDIYTYSGTSTAQLYILTDMNYTSGSDYGILANPKGTGIQ